MKPTFPSLVLILSVLATASCGTAPVDKTDSALTNTLYQAAFSAEQSTDYRSAIQYYQKLRQRSPDDLDIVLALARNLRYDGAEQEAVSILDTAENLDKNSATYLIEYSKAKIALGKFEESITFLDKAVLIDGENWEIYSMLGIAHDLLGNFPLARKAYDTALFLSRDNPAIYNNMAISAALSGNLDKAISILNGVPRLTRNNMHLRQNLAFFYGINGDVKSAEALARKDLDEEAVRKNLKLYSQFRAY